MLKHVYQPEREHWNTRLDQQGRQVYCHRFTLLRLSQWESHISPHQALSECERPWRSKCWECFIAVLLLRMTVTWVADCPKMKVYWNSNDLKECRAAFNRRLNIYYLDMDMFQENLVSFGYSGIKNGLVIQSHFSHLHTVLFGLIDFLTLIEQLKIWIWRCI